MICDFTAESTVKQEWSNPFAKFLYTSFPQTRILDSMPFSDFTAESIVKTEWSNPLQKFLYTSFPQTQILDSPVYFERDFHGGSTVRFQEWSIHCKFFIPHFPRPKSGCNALLVISRRNQ
ncbi:hypothetical protein AVEN_246763-1 [Araneus ventricosus]|uniref:Uncharacterized protein n=1 Tax=Araneus ventricosus TaxID=182803 RepID=A0A4Y2QZ76_ARAVE|nr:hypothetical protein AVEN_246763-1 [Araneus ventricosus]